ncbi:MAG: secretion system protein F, partial [Anaerolineales bacterium]
SDMVGRVDTDETELVVTAINVQYETGGNLAETLDIIGETIRDRIRIQREIRVFTAQQRLSGYVLAALPVALALIIFAINPRFFAPFLEPGWPRMLPIAAVVMQVAGFVIMRRIIDIEV